MTADALARGLSLAWERGTSSDPVRWTPENPAWGQCAVTACVVQDVLGGEVVWAQAALPAGERISHYFNRLADGEIRDYTRSQFPEGTVFDPPEGREKTNGFAATRDYVLSFPATRARYETLKSGMERNNG